MEKKIPTKKELKEKNLINASFELFTTKGINETSIDDIVKKAGVAKGTFYLYFKDKFDIINKLTLKKSSQILKEALDCCIEKEFQDFIEEVIFFTNYLIEYFKKDKISLSLINKNFSWSIYKRAVFLEHEYKELKLLVDIYINNIEKLGFNQDEATKMLFIIIELIGSVCYSSIIQEQPDNIDEMKPVLFTTIRKILTK